MTWPEFVTLFVTLTAVVLLLARHYFDGHWHHLAQVTIFIVSLTFFIDYPAEQRRFWSFSSTTGIMILDTPLENHLFVGACAIDIMIVYLSLRRCLPDSSHADEPRQPPSAV